jgi:uncharacterized protein YbjT (DUF2867 family)
MILVVGATGLLGGEVVRQLRSSDQAVRALTRTTSNPAHIEALRRAGAEVVFGDLRQSESVRDAVQRIEAIITTASSTISKLRCSH